MVAIKVMVSVAFVFRVEMEATDFYEVLINQIACHIPENHNHDSC
jgi:hypothetical protein